MPARECPSIPFVCNVSVPGFAADDGDVGLIERANLGSDDTGVAGTISISSRQGSHGARVKWYPRPIRAQEDSCLSVTVSQKPVVRNFGLNARDVRAGSDDVSAWVALNHDALLRFWNEGHGWERRAVSRFIDGLRRLG